VPGGYWGSISYWETSPNEISFSVSANGDIENLTLSIPLQKYNSAYDEECRIGGSGTYPIIRDGYTIDGTVEGSSASGTYLISECMGLDGNYYTFSPPLLGTWVAERLGQ
jgi:hypothetical protein